MFQLNGEKTKELVISFSRDSPQLPRVCIDGTLSINMPAVALFVKFSYFREVKKGAFFQKSQQWLEHVLTCDNGFCRSEF